MQFHTFAVLREKIEKVQFPAERQWEVSRRPVYQIGPKICWYSIQVGANKIPRLKDSEYWA